MYSVISINNLLSKHHGIDRETAKSLLYYKGDGHSVINHFLRTGEFIKTEKIPTESVMNITIKNILSSMNLLRKRKVVYRGFIADEKDIINKEYLVDNGFMSTSTNIGKTAKFILRELSSKCCIFQISLSEDLMVFDFDDSEKEILVENGTKMINFQYQGTTVIDECEFGLFTCDLEKASDMEMKISLKNERKKLELEKQMEEILKNARLNFINDLDEEYSDLFE